MDLPDWSDGRALLARVIGPALVLWAGLVGIGFALAGPLSGPLRDEVYIDRYLAAERSHSWNTITLLWSDLGSTEVVIGASLIIGALTLWRTRDWRLAAVPTIAVLIETVIFLSLASLVNRERPPVVKLDVAPPTSSYPSGHVGASTALYLAFAFLALHISPSPSWHSISRGRGCGGPWCFSASSRHCWLLSRACTGECITSPTSLQALSMASSVCCLPTAGIAIDLFLTPTAKLVDSRYMTNQGPAAGGQSSGGTPGVRDTSGPRPRLEVEVGPRRSEGVRCGMGAGYVIDEQDAVVLLADRDLLKKGVWICMNPHAAVLELAAVKPVAGVSSAGIPHRDDKCSDSCLLQVPGQRAPRRWRHVGDGQLTQPSVVADPSRLESAATELQCHAPIRLSEPVSQPSSHPGLAICRPFDGDVGVVEPEDGLSVGALLIHHPRQVLGQVPFARPAGLDPLAHHMDVPPVQGELCC